MANPQSSSAILENAATDMKQQGKSTRPIRSSTFDMICLLTGAQYGVDELLNVRSKLPSDPNAYTMAMLDLQGAHLNKSVKNTDTRSMMQSVGNVDATLNLVQKSKMASSYHAQSVSSFAPLKGDANQRQMQHEELDHRVNKFIIEEMQAKLKEIGKELNLHQSSDKISHELEGLTKQVQELVKQASRLEINVSGLQTKLEELHRQIYGLLPAAERGGVKPPTPVTAPTTTPTQEGPE